MLMQTGGCRETRHSTRGYVLTLNRGPIYWESQRQTIIALSSAESGDVSLSSCAKMSPGCVASKVGTRSPLGEKATVASTMVLSDSTASLALVLAWNKYIDIKVHHVKDRLKNNVINLHYVASSEKCRGSADKKRRFPHAGQARQPFASQELRYVSCEYGNLGMEWKYQYVVCVFSLRTLQ